MLKVKCLGRNAAPLFIDHFIQSVPLATEPGICLIILSLIRILQRNSEADSLHCVINVTTS